MNSTKSSRKPGIHVCAESDNGIHFGRRLVNVAGAKLYQTRAQFEDALIGGISLEGVYESRFKELGATQTQSTDYRLLDHMFKAVPLSNDDSLLDIGCGEGRVLSYLRIHGFEGGLVGIELDEDVAERACRRLAETEGVRILCANVFECWDEIAAASTIFMFNPFDGDATLDLIELIEKVHLGRLSLYYCGDYYHSLLDNRPNWSLLAHDNVKRAGALPLSYSIYEFSGNS